LRSNQGEKLARQKRKLLMKAEKPAAFTPVAMKAVMEVGAPS